MAEINEKIYEEVGTNYRFFLGWRHATFAGYIVIIGAAVSVSASTFKDVPSLAWLFPLGAFPIGFLLWIIDIKTRKLYGALQRAGASMEGQTGGGYTNICSVSAPTAKRGL